MCRNVTFSPGSHLTGGASGPAPENGGSKGSHDVVTPCEGNMGVTTKLEQSMASDTILCGLKYVEEKTQVEMTAQNYYSFCV